LKSAAFDYVKPDSLPKVLALLAQHGDDARILAGGQTLMATLNMRLSEPQLVVDITGLSELRGIRVEGNMLRIGALVTHTEIETSALVAQHAPLLRDAAPHIAHRAIRNSGTFGGSIAYADPAAEWPACFLALDGVAIIAGEAGQRRVPAAQFFQGLYATALAATDVLVACEIPIAQRGDWHSFSELARRHGDYAIVGLAAQARRQGEALADVRIALMGVDTTPVRATAAEAALNGRVPDAARIAEAVAALRAEIDPLADLTHSGESKRHLVGVLLTRALRTAL
jgi:aerobic carbon-monoxide dehydrogenase medium subunit